MKPTEEIISQYIRDDLAALEDPHRKDERMILDDLGRSFRSYRNLFREDWIVKRGDWIPCP